MKGEKSLSKLLLLTIKRNDYAISTGHSVSISGDDYVIGSDHSVSIRGDDYAIGSGHSDSGRWWLVILILTSRGRATPPTTRRRPQSSGGLREAMPLWCCERCAQIPLKVGQNVGMETHTTLHTHRERLTTDSRTHTHNTQRHTTNSRVHTHITNTETHNNSQTYHTQTHVSVNECCERRVNNNMHKVRENSTNQNKTTRTKTTKRNETSEGAERECCESKSRAWITKQKTKTKWIW